MSLFDNAPENMLEKKCISCHLFQEIDTIFEEYAHFIFDHLSAGMLGLFSAFTALWVIWQIMTKFMTEEGPDFRAILKQFLFYSFLVLLLSSRTLFWDMIYNPLKDLMFSASIMVLEGPTKSMLTHVPMVGNYEGPVYKILNLADIRFRQLISLGEAIMRGKGIFTMISVVIASLILQAIYFYNWIYFLLLLVEGLVKFTLMAVLAPVAIIAGAFPATRSIATNSLKTVLSAGLQIFLVVVMISFSFFVIGAYEDSFPVGPDGNIDIENAGGFLESSLYYFLIIVGVLTAFLLRKAQHISAEITGGTSDLGGASTLAKWVTGGVGLATKGPAMLAGREGWKYAKDKYKDFRNK